MMGQEDEAGVRVVGEHWEARLWPRVNRVRLIRIAGGAADMGERHPEGRGPVSRLTVVTDVRAVSAEAAPLLHQAADAVFEASTMVSRGSPLWRWLWLWLMTLDTGQFFELFMQVRHCSSSVKIF